ncbi:MAG: IclR family transcriptional regulator [Firmicutes bacterium]|nr:IclR family transcriptional regulator [Bacillota bacterium]
MANNTLELLEYICSSRKKDFSLSELSSAFQVNKSTMHRMLRVLTERGYLRQEPKTGRYLLNWKLLELGAQVNAKLGLLETVSPYMEQLARETGETVNLAVLYDKKVVYIHKVESTHFLRTDLRVGITVPAYCSALGKAILAWHTEEQLAKILSAENLVPFTPQTITDPDLFKKELTAVKKRGYAVDIEEYIPGIICVAAPILNRQGKAIAAISIAGPGLRISEEKVAAVGELVRVKTKEISSRCG